MNGMWNGFFKFKPILDYNLNLDGSIRRIVSTKPPLRQNRTYHAKFLKKERYFIHAQIIGEDGKPVMHTIIEVK